MSSGLDAAHDWWDDCLSLFGSEQPHPTKKCNRCNQYYHKHTGLRFVSCPEVMHNKDNKDERKSKKR